MTKPGLIVSAGKLIAAAAGRRALKGRSAKLKPEDLLNDSTLEKQGAAVPQKSGAARRKLHNESVPATQADPANPNDLDYENQDPGQEQAGDE